MQIFADKILVKKHLHKKSWSCGGLPYLERRGWIQLCWKRGGCAILPDSNYNCYNSSTV